MYRLFDDKNNVLMQSDNVYPITMIMCFLEKNGYICMTFDYLSELVETMTDSSTTFNTLGEMILEIPEIISCTEECEFLQVIDIDNDINSRKWFILGWNYEEELELCNKILQSYFPEYEIKEFIE